MPPCVDVNFKVIDINSAAISSALIDAKATTLCPTGKTWCFTDVDGKCTLRLDPNKDYEIIIAKTGYKTKTFGINSAGGGDIPDTVLEKCQFYDPTEYTGYSTAWTAVTSATITEESNVKIGGSIRQSYQNGYVSHLGYTKNNGGWIEIGQNPKNTYEEVFMMIVVSKGDVITFGLKWSGKGGIVLGKNLFITTPIPCVDTNFTVVDSLLLYPLEDAIVAVTEGTVDCPNNVWWCATDVNGKCTLKVNPNTTYKIGVKKTGYVDEFFYIESGNGGDQLQLLHPHQHPRLPQPQHLHPLLLHPQTQ